MSLRPHGETEALRNRGEVWGCAGHAEPEAAQAPSAAGAKEERPSEEHAEGSRDASALLSKLQRYCQIASSANVSTGTNLQKFPVPATDHSRTCYSLVFWLLLRTRFSGDVSFMVLKLSFQG